jgi:methyl-accepting chemotaxis protein
MLLLALMLAGVGAGSLARVERITAETVGALIRAGELSANLAGTLAEQVREAELQLLEPSPDRLRRITALGDSAHAARRELQRWDGFGPADLAVLNRIEVWQSRAEVAWSLAHGMAEAGRTGDRIMAVSEARLATDSLRAEVRRLETAQQQRAIGRAGLLAEENARRRNLLWFLVVAALAVGLGSAVLAVRAVDRPLGRLAAAMDRFGRGDLRPADLGGMPAEAASLGSSMNLMGARLRELTTGIHDEAGDLGGHAAELAAMSEELAATSGEVSAAMVRLSEGAARQLGAAHEAGQGLVALRDAGAATLRAAQRVEAVSGSLADLAIEHRQHIGDASRVLLALRETVRATAGELREAARQGEALSGLADRDRQLASTVGVLAVNSAIEAARAGAHGQGLLAVAEELRALERHCLAAAEETDRAVKQVQERIARTTSTLDAGSTTVLGVEATADRAASAFLEIGSGVHGMRDQVTAVVAAAEQARERIRLALERVVAIGEAAREHATTGETVSAAAQEQAAATEELAAAAARLSDSARRLDALVDGFRT